MKVVFCTPTVKRPYAPFLKALEAALPAVEALGWQHEAVYEIANPYISAARSIMLRKALDAGADAVMFLDHDVSFQPDAIARLLQRKEDVVAATYRFKKAEEEYMGSVLSNQHGTPLIENGLIRADRVPAGFLKMTERAVNRFMEAHPELCYGPRHRLSVDLFNHGAHKGTWYGEDYAFSRNWVDMGEPLYILPNLEVNHHGVAEDGSDIVYRGNYNTFLRRQPGGDLCEAKAA